MPAFWIGFTEEEFVEVEPGEEGRVGLIVLGQHEETFPIHLSTWSVSQYMDHWKRALLRALTGMASALVTDMMTPAQSSHLVWWPMWKIEDQVVFHNQLFFFDQYGLLERDPKIEDLYEFIGGRKTQNEEGISLSEWIVSIADIKRFLADG